MAGLLAFAVRMVYFNPMVDAGAHGTNVQTRCLRATLGVLAAALMLLSPWRAAIAAHDGVFLYKVLRDGAEIGYHRVTLAQRDGHLEVAVAAEIEVKLAFVTVYSFKHNRREVWADGHLLGVAAKTDNDGSTYEVQIEPNGEGYTRSLNGQVEHLDRDRRLLTYWDKSIVDHKAFISAQDGSSVDVSFDSGGTQKLDWNGRQVEAAYYRMTGDVERELWYDRGGHVLKLRMLRDGAEILYLRQ